MFTLLIALAAGLGFIAAYHTYGRWLGSRIFRLSADAVAPSVALRDDADYVPTPKSVVFGHHFTSIAGTGPIVGPAIAVMWGWLPALLWVVLGSIFIGAVHDFGALVVSLRNQGKTVGDVAGVVINRRTRLLFLCVLFLCLLIVIAIFGLVIANVLTLYPSAIFPTVVQIPIAVAIGLWLHRRGVSLVLPSVLALVLMYASVIFGDWRPLHAFNQALAAWPLWAWVILLLAYGYVASVLPVWALLQPRDFINALQLVTALGLIVVGLAAAAAFGGAPPVEGAARVPLEVVAPAVNWSPAGAPPLWPFLFITIACGACSGFHCLVSSGTSSKQLRSEPDARFVGYGAMLTEGFLAVLVILACVAGLGLGTGPRQALYGEIRPPGVPSVQALSWYMTPSQSLVRTANGDFFLANGRTGVQEAGLVPLSPAAAEAFGPIVLSDAADGLPPFAWHPTGLAAFNGRYATWQTADGLGAKVGAFVDGAGNFVAAAGVPRTVAVALMAVLVASFAGTTLDTAVRLQRYVVEELWAAVWGSVPDAPATSRAREEAERAQPASAVDPRAGAMAAAPPPLPHGRGSRRASVLKHAAAFLAVASALALAAVPPDGVWSVANFGKGGLVLWPLFGATNQLLAGLAFAVILFYLRRRSIPTWFLVGPMLFMLIVPAWAMLAELPGWVREGRYVLGGIGLACLILELWMVTEAALLWRSAKGREEGEAEPRGFEVGPRVTSAE